MLTNRIYQDIYAGKVFEAAVHALGAQRLMVVADNHVSIAGWCCLLGDGQRWFNEDRFPVEPWLDALRCGHDSLHPNAPSLLPLYGPPAC